MSLRLNLGQLATRQVGLLPSDARQANDNAVYSVRKVVPSYTGYALRTRRSSDNAEADVSFDSNGLVSDTSPVTLVSDGSTSTLGNFRSGDGFVSIWYNQCKNTETVTITDTGTVIQLGTGYPINVGSNDFSISGTFTQTIDRTSGFQLLENLDGTNDGIEIFSTKIGRAAGTRASFNSVDITLAITSDTLSDGNDHTYTLSRSGNTLTFDVDGTSGTADVTGQSISVGSEAFLAGNAGASRRMAGEVSAFTVSIDGTQTYNIKDAYIYNAVQTTASNQPVLNTSSGLNTNSNGDVSFNCNGTSQFLYPNRFMNLLSDTDTGFLTYAESNTTSYSTEHPVISQHQETFGTPLAGSIYLGASSAGWTVFQAGGSDGINVTAGETTSLTRPTLLAMGKPSGTSGTATVFRSDTTNGRYANVTDTFNTTMSGFYFGIGHGNGSDYFDGDISEVIILSSGSSENTEVAFNEQKAYWGV